MKKVRLLFVLYFFVIQVALIGVLFTLPQLYTLALINLVAVGVIVLIAKRFGEGQDEHHESKEPAKKAHHEVKEAVAPAHIYETPHHTGKKSPGGSSLIPFVISLIVFIILFGVTYAVDFGVRLLVISILSAIIFWLLCLFWKAHVKGFNKLLGTRLYRALLLLSIMILGYQYVGQTQSLRDYLGQQVPAMFIGGNVSVTTPSQDPFVFKQEGTVLNSGTSTGDSATAQIDSSLLSGATPTDTTPPPPATTGTTPPIENTPTTPVQTPPTTLPTHVGTSLHMIDMIKHLISTYNLPLVSQTDIAFTHVASTSPDYPYMRTAYAHRLIGLSTTSTKFALCDTYIVMKGILEKWTVTSKTNVMQAYRDYAVANDKLNGCAQGAVLKQGNL